MKALKIAVLSLMMFSGYSLAESTSLSAIEGCMMAWNAHNVSRAAQFLADDTVYYDAAVEEPIGGKERAEREVIGAFIKAVPDLSWKMAGKPVCGRSTVAFRWEFSGKSSGEWAESPPTDDPIKFEGVSYVHVGTGKVTWQGGYYDSEKLDEELKPVRQSVMPLCR